MTGWSVVVPVKGTANAKSRLGASRDQALAIALDTVEAAASVAPVTVVVHPSAAACFRQLGVAVLEDAGTDLNRALAGGIAVVGPGRIACLQGDLPALTGAELRVALAAAEEHERAYVPDADGSGTVLLAARRADLHRPRFGAGSARSHEAEGYVRLDLEGVDGLRHDVDTVADLRRHRDALGPRTRAAFGGPGRA